jgi:hypothetical protein
MPALQPAGGRVMQRQADPRYQVWEVLVRMLSYHHPSAFLFANHN